MNLQELIDSGKFDLARQTLKADIEKNGDTEKKQFVKASLFYRLERYEEAENIFLNLYQKNKKSGVLLFNLGLTFLERQKKMSAFRAFEQAYEFGNEQSIYKLVTLLFEREGFCDYQNCADSCCQNVVLTNNSGEKINSETAFEKLLQNPKSNKNWIKKSENKKGEWIFSCSQLGEKNTCKVHNTRPQVCRDFPQNILALKNVCSYSFKLVPVKFSSPKSYAVLVDILNNYGYTKEVEELNVLHKIR